MLNDVLNIRGVRGATFVDGAGCVLHRGGQAPDPDLAGMGADLAASFAHTLGGGELRDLLLDFEDGPVLLTALGEGKLLTAFDDAANLGRLRYALKRAAAGLAK